MAMVKREIEAGLVIRGEVRSALKGYCFSKGYELDLQEDAGWLSTTFYVKITCPDSEAYKVKRELDNFLNQFNEDEDE